MQHLQPLKSARDDGGGSLVHRAGGGRDLGYSKSTADLKTAAHLTFRVAAPLWWCEQDVENFLTDSGWQKVDVLAQLGRGTCRIRCTARPEEQTTYMYEVDGIYVKVVPQTRKHTAPTMGKYMNRPQLSWLERVKEESAEAKAQEAAEAQPASQTTQDVKMADASGEQ